MTEPTSTSTADTDPTYSDDGNCRGCGEHYADGHAPGCGTDPDAAALFTTWAALIG